MRNLFILGILVVGAFMAGWFTIDREGDQTTIKINRSEIRNDAKTAISKGRVYLDSKLDNRSQPTGSSQYPEGLRYSQQGGQYNQNGGYGIPQSATQGYSPSAQGYRPLPNNGPNPTYGPQLQYPDYSPMQSAGYPQQSRIPDQYSR